VNKTTKILEQPARDSYVRRMKRISILFMAAVCGMPGALRAQDAAVEERLNQMTARIEILIEGQKAQSDRIAALEKELSALQRQSRAGEGSVSPEDLRLLREKLQEVDQNRVKDYERTARMLENLRETLSAPSPRKPNAAAPADPSPGKPVDGFEYVVQSGDNLSLIVAAYKEKNIKVTVEQILKANPGLKPEKLKIGQKIFIPAPAPAP
jgi:hypothetical protein